MKSILVNPDPALLEAMRSIGYTVEAAVADVIDNSVAAGAEGIEILVSPDGPFEIAILDDGAGMSRAEAVDAMRLAATSPSAERRHDDLGRFGLGLKTASLSQCRTLTLLTKKDGKLTALQWSLEHVIRSGEWSLIELEADEVKDLLGWDEISARHKGTLVHWGDLDQLMMTEGHRQEDLDRVAHRVRDHVALVFHLFIEGDGTRKIRFSMNGAPIEPIDPFMSHSRLTSKTPWESINVEGQEVRLMAYTLPYLNRLSQSDRARALRLGGLRETQGFYVYRASRLVIWGNWFRVMPRSEMAKLTRVRVEIPNSLDHLWALDVKKSHADPPPQVRRRLRELARTMMQPGEKVQKFRGRRVNHPAQIDYMWVPRVNGDEFTYEINPGHPTIDAFTKELSEDQVKQFQLLMEDLQNTFPVIDAHNRMSGDKVPEAPDEADLVERAVAGWALAGAHGLDQESFIVGLSRSDPYCLVSNFDKKLREALGP